MSTSLLPFQLEERPFLPLPVYQHPDGLPNLRICRTITIMILCPYCRRKHTQKDPLPHSSLGMCCLQCYERFRVAYLEHIQVANVEDSEEEREKYIKVLKNRQHARI